MAVLKVAAIQMTCGADVGKNLASLERAVREAVSHGASLIATPENSDLLGVDREEKLRLSFEDGRHPMVALCQSLARELSVWILLGSVAVRCSETKVYNRSYLFSPRGEIVAQYNKIHLFDVDLPSGEVRRESELVEAGSQAVVADLDGIQAGLSICYDVRFPHLYRELAQAGAELLFVPAAFTVSTGEMHWETLLRARAIENGAFVIAPAQCGDHGGGRKTYGHSMIISPWGKILAEAGSAPDIIYADIDMEDVASFRKAIPSLQHDRDFSRS